jgi:zinc/manganese transport system permease protein
MRAILLDPFWTFGFMRTALVACLGLALANAPVGVLLLQRRMSLTADILSHAIMPGAALGLLLAGYSLFALTLGGIVAGVLVALLSSLTPRLNGEGS